jgi:hypothetical protein
VTWVDSFAERHLGVSAEVTESGVIRFAGEDGAIAECHVPFPPVAHMPPDAAGASGVVGAAGAAAVAQLIADHATADRTVGVLLVRLGGYAAGVFAGSPPRLVASKVGSRLVHGRSAAGGTSQHRFARRREKQATEAIGTAADTAAAVFGQAGRKLDALVLGGDRTAISSLRDDPRLAAYFAKAADRFLTVPDPRLAVLRETPRMFRVIRIRLIEPAPGEARQPEPGPGSAHDGEAFGA